MSRSLSCVLIFAVSLVLALPVRPAGARTTFPIEGHKGAVGRLAACEPGSYLVGFRGRTGAWFDQIGPVCAPMLAGGHLGKRKTLARYGGKGGDSTFDVYCDDGEIITSSRVSIENDGRAVYELAFRCYSASTGIYSDRFKRIRPKKGSRNTSIKKVRDCPPGEAAIGMNIRYGAHVNGLGMVCGEVVAPQPANVEATPAPAEAASFAGTWDSTIAGIAVTLELQVNGRQVKGTMTSIEPNLTGNIYGKMDGRDYLYIAETGSGSTSGMLTLNGTAFEGAYRVDGRPMSWEGRRR